MPLWGTGWGWCCRSTWVGLSGTHLWARPSGDPNWVGDWAGGRGGGQLQGATCMFCWAPHCSLTQMQPRSIHKAAMETAQPRSSPAGGRGPREQAAGSTGGDAGGRESAVVSSSP